MPRNVTPAQWLLLLLAGAGGLSGWLYGLNWKRIASGGGTTHEERLIIDLQDQLDRLRSENQRLSGQLHEWEARGKGAGFSESPGTPEAPGPPRPVSP